MVRGLASFALVACAGMFAASAAMHAHAAAWQEKSCRCFTALDSRLQRVGTILSSTGSVLVSKTAGLQPALPGDGLQAGSRLVVGLHSSATIVIGKSCMMTISQSSDVSLPLVPGGTCVRMEQARTIQPTAASGAAVPDIEITRRLRTTGAFSSANTASRGLAADADGNCPDGYLRNQDPNIGPENDAYCQRDDDRLPIIIGVGAFAGTSGLLFSINGNNPASP